MSFEKILKHFSARKASPTGGALFAFEAAAALAFAERIALYSDMKTFSKTLTGLRKKLLSLAEKDTGSFTKYLKTKNKKYLKESVRIPLKAAEILEASGKITGAILKRGNKNFRTDAAGINKIVSVCRKTFLDLARENLAKLPENK